MQNSAKVPYVGLSLLCVCYWHCPVCPHPHGARSRVYETVEHPSVRPSHRSTAAAVCGEFAASLLSALRTGDIDRQQVPAISSSQQRCRDAAFGSNVSSVTLTADVGG